MIKDKIKSERCGIDDNGKKASPESHLAPARQVLTHNISDTEPYLHMACGDSERAGEISCVYL